MANGFDPRSAKFVRPVGVAPDKDAPAGEREAWAMALVPWFIEITGGEAPDEPAGQRWREEYFQCVCDPAAYEIAIAGEVEAALKR